MSRIKSRVLAIPILAIALTANACSATNSPATTTVDHTTTSTISGATITTLARPTTTTTGTTTPTTTTTLANDTNQLASGSGCTPGPGDLPDGEWFGRVEEVTEMTVSFDLACWFTGDAAATAAAEDGEESPPPNDYYVRNENPATRAVTVASNTPLVFYPGGDPLEEVETTFSEWGGLVAERGGFFFGVWITIEGGIVTQIKEQWVP